MQTRARQPRVPVAVWIAMWLFGALAAAFAALPALAGAQAPVPLPAVERPLRPDREPVTIEFWHAWDEWRTELMAEVVRRFEEAFPWIHVDINLVPLAAGPRMDRAITAYAAGTPPDLLMAQRFEVPWFAANEMIRPIDDFVEERELDLAIFFPGELGGFTYEGRLYSLPMPGGGGTTYLLTWNSNMLREAGLPNEPARTWREYLEYARRINRYDAGDVPVKYVAPPPGSAFRPLLYSNNGTYYDPDSRRITFDSEEGREVLYFIRDAHALFRGPIPPAGRSEFFTDQSAVYWINQSIFGHSRELAPDLEYVVGTVPYNDERPGAAGHGVIDAGWGYVIPRTAPEDRAYAAYLLLEWLAAEESGGVWFLKQQGRPSAVIAFATDPYFYEITPQWAEFVEVLLTDLPIPLTPVDSEIRTIMARMVSSMTSGELAPEIALAEGARQAQQAIDDFYRGQ